MPRIACHWHQDRKATHIALVAPKYGVIYPNRNADPTFSLRCVECINAIIEPDVKGLFIFELATTERVILKKGEKL